LAASASNYDTGGEIELSFTIMTQQEADSNKVGVARDEPNKDPFLETPKEGRSLLDKLSFIKDLAAGLGSLYGNLFAFIKTIGVILTIALVAYTISGIIK
jgi:hypothetical protein